MNIWIYITPILSAFVHTAWTNSIVELEKETLESRSSDYYRKIVSKYECGGHFMGMAGSITSPNYPNFYNISLNCAFVIGELGNYVTLAFDKPFSVKGRDPCTSHYVEIYDGEISASKSQGRYCGDTAPGKRTLNGPATVTFVSDHRYEEHRYKLLYDILDCDAEYAIPSGTISIVGKYLKRTKFCWRIAAPENYVVQLRVFLNFNLEKEYGHSEVIFFDGNSTSGPRIEGLCGKDTLPTVKSSGRDLTVIYNSGRAGKPLEFSLHYRVAFGEAQGCGGRLSSPNGTIAFRKPVGPTTVVQPGVIDCVWLIVANEPDQVVTLTYESFTMRAPTNGSCDDDFLEIREVSSDGPVLGTYCGNHLPEKQTTSAAAVSVHLRSHTSDPAATFKLRYAVTPSPCGPSTLIATPEPQTLTSPGYPSPYSGNIKCKWTLKINQTLGRSQVASYYKSPIAMSITDIDIPCGGNYLEITRATVDFMKSGHFRFCGDKPPQLEQARGVMEINFNGNASNKRGRGFSLTFRTASCNTTYSDDNGVVLSYNFPLRANLDRKCSFSIIAPEGRTVALYFTQFELGYGYSSGNCDRDYMKVHDGFGESTPVVESFCGKNLQDPVFSTGRSLFVDVNAPAGIGLYFLTYTTTDKGRGCGGRFSSAKGSFSSPLYPQPHSVPGECVWRVSVPGYHAVRLRFTSFALANSTASNYLEVYEGLAVRREKRIARFCGTNVPGELELLSNEATVRLVTESSNDQPGFYAHFETSDYMPVDVPMKVAQYFNKSQMANDEFNDEISI